MPRKKIGEEEKLINQEIGKRIKNYRRFRKITQEKMADSLGVTLNQYCLYEKGKGDIRVGVLCQVAKLLKVPTMELLPPCEGCDTLSEQLINLISVVTSKEIKVEDLIDKINKGEI